MLFRSIDEILSVKSADRRELFEEAAGISKFRYRKEESERKLSSCEENLVRIRDIVTELETQVGPLKVQAEKAKRFLLLRDELRVLEVSVFLRELDTIKGNLEVAQTDFDNGQRLLSARQRELDELYIEIEQIGEQMAQKEREGEGIRQDVRNHEATLAREQSDRAVCRTNLENNRKNIDERVREMSESEGRAQSLDEQAAARRERIDEMKVQIEKKTGELDDLLNQAEQKAREGDDLRDQADSLRSNIELFKTKAQQLALLRAGIDSGRVQLDTRRADIERERQELSGSLDEQQERARQLDALIEENEEKRQSAQNMLSGYGLRLQSRSRKAEELKASVEQYSRKIAASTDRLNLLCALEREYEGFSHAVRRVLTASDKGALSGIHGPVSRLIRVHDDHAVAVEIALGAGMQNVVVEDEQSAKRAIGFLKQGDHGRATFLPLTAVRERGGNRRDLSGARGFVGYADELTECDDK